MLSNVIQYCVLSHVNWDISTYKYTTTKKNRMIHVFLLPWSEEWVSCPWGKERKLMVLVLGLK